MWILAAAAQNPGSLKNVPVPQPGGADKYIRDPRSLVLLGKALFWDMQAGSDGRTACASCHFHAGADHRNQNQLSNASGSVAVNRVLAAQDFPFHVVSNPNDNRSPVVRDTTAVAGSAGVFRRVFQDVTAGSAADSGFDSSDTVFSRNGVNTRQVTVRNTPTVINAVFNVRNFWD
jgi:cytochrome c peroxidase